MNDGWHDVSEKMPNKLVPVHVQLSETIACIDNDVAYYDPDHGPDLWRFVNTNVWTDMVTHWKPMERHINENHYVAIASECE